LHSSYTDTRFFGQPKALSHLLFTEAFERFAHIGMQALLVLYMTKYVLLAGNREDVWLLLPLQHLLGGISGQPLASAIFGLFTALVFASQIAGGFIADRYLGIRQSILTGCILLTAGYVLLVFKPTFLIALLSLILGNGLFKSNMATEVGQIYGNDDPRRVDGYQLFTISISIGGIAAALLIGPIGEKLGWSFGFIIAAFSMACSAIVFRSGQRNLQDEPIITADGGVPIVAGQSDAKRATWKLCLLLPLVSVLVVPNYQIFNAYLIWGDANFDMTVFGYPIPTTSLVFFAGIASITGTVICMCFWRWWRERWTNPSDLTKMLIGALLLLAGTICLVLAAAWQKPDTRISLILPLAFHLLAATGYAHIVPVGLAMVGRLAPVTAKSTAMGFYYLAFGIGSVLVGAIGAYYSSTSATIFWAIHAGMVAFSCVSLTIMRQLGFGNGEVSSHKVDVAVAA
jgi:proton-dependent oligopeptide transporter, POT family